MIFTTIYLLLINFGCWVSLWWLAVWNLKLFLSHCAEKLHGCGYSKCNCSAFVSSGEHTDGVKTSDFSWLTTNICSNDKETKFFPCSLWEIPLCDVRSTRFRVNINWMLAVILFWMCVPGPSVQTLHFRILEMHHKGLQMFCEQIIISVMPYISLYYSSIKEVECFS